MQFIKRMSFFSKNLLLAFFNIVLIGSILIASGYIIQKDILIKQLRGQISAITQEWAQEMDPAKIQQAITENSYEGAVQLELKATLDLIHKYNPNIAQAYVFGTELANGNQTSIIAMPTNLVEAFSSENMGVGAMYDQPVAMSTAITEMLNTGVPTFTSFYSDDFGIWTTILYPIKDSSGKIFAFFAADVDASAVPNGLKTLLISGITIMLIFLVLIFLLQFFISRMTMKPIKELIRGIEEVSGGNLNVELKSGVDDLGVVNHKFNIMIRRINDMMVKVRLTSHAVTDSAKSLYEFSEKNSKTVEEITENMREINVEIANQELSSSEAAKAMNEMSTVIQNIAQSSSSVAEEAGDMEHKSKEGNRVVGQVVQQMEQIEKFVVESSSAIQSLASRSQEIENIVSLIMGVATQTNLLALNAAIEAARVGEHGKGFAVVAGEVRKLAEQSNSSATQISTLIKEIQQEITTAVDALNLGTGQVRTGLQISSETGSLLDDILSATRSVTLQIQEVSSSTEQISAGTEELTATAENLSASAGITAANSAKISKSIVEQKESMNAIVESSTQLTQMSEELQELINHFQVRTS
ncbi:HAMP domain-containing methyl-accepting chemotaxis protein [Paenibacillus sp. KS-LC4]|uniref:methyl-accepting chemotaxis protein n=1 Tax=Paenibacillus sp. KS-LC4 TaxID=2979727 RepID=UPI0030CFDF1F